MNGGADAIAPFDYLQGPRPAMMERRRALLLVNRQSRSGSRGVEKALPLLARGHIAVDQEAPGDADHTARLIRARRDRIDLVIVAGGDGTINATASALLETGLPLGILPLGTGNDLARTLGIPPDIEMAAGVIAAGLTRPIDVGLVNDRPFFNAATIGLSNEAARRLTGEVKRRWGPVGYPLTLLDAWRATHPFRSRITIGEEVEERRSIQIVVGNGRHHGAGMTVSASAQIDDHVLDLYSLDAQPWWSVLRHLPDLRRGADHAPEGMWRGQGRRATVETERAMRVRTDGEPTTRTPARFEILPGAVEALAPPPDLSGTAPDGGRS
jgi:YegS/Rv2252/BmrU family lipid kinase